MNIKKIMAALAAAAMAVTMTAISTFAIVVDTEYSGAWSASKSIPRSEFAAIGGDVNVVLTVETKKPLVGQANYLAKPMNICASWDAITDSLTSDTAIAKEDGFFVFAEGQTTLEFVVPQSVWESFVDYNGTDGPEAGLAFQINDVIILSAELSSGAPQSEIRRVAEDQSAEIMAGKSYEEVTGITTTTSSPATGNASVAAIVAVMALAGAAAIACRKN